MTAPDLNYYCSYCGRLFRLKWQLTAHIRVHEKRTPFICHVCPASFVRNSDLKNHLKSHSEDRPFKCKFCPKAFKTKFSKECHEDTHGVNSYNCNTCEESFSTYMKLNRHKKRHKKMSIVFKKNGQVHYQCTFCSSFFLSMEFKKHHEETIHHKIDGEKDDIYIQASKCPICYKKFSNGKDYRTHIYEIHPNDAENVFYTKCTICNKKVSAAFYSYHMMAHNGIKPHACTVCDIKFTRKHDLLRHMDIHSDETPYKCSQCPKKFKCKKNLNMHIKSHLKKDKLCDMCNKSFATKEKLINHKNRIHLRDQNLEKCTICKKEVLNQYMSRHMKEFHCFDEKLCDHCGQTFPNAFKLRIHITRYCKETETYKAKALYQQHVKTNSYPELSLNKIDTLFYSSVKECFLCGLIFFHKNAFIVHLRFHEYENWELSWNAKNIYRRKKNTSKGKRNNLSSSNNQEIYVVKDVKKISCSEIMVGHDNQRETIIAKYEYIMCVKKELSWIQSRYEDKKKLVEIQPLSSFLGSSQLVNKVISSYCLLKCNKCKKVNKIKETDPNNVLFVFFCEHCSSINERIKNTANSDHSIINTSFNSSAKLGSFNLGPSNIFPVIIMAPPVVQNITKKEKFKHGKVDPCVIKVEESAKISDVQIPNTVASVITKVELASPVSHICSQQYFDGLEQAVENVSRIGDINCAEDEEILKAMKDNLAVLQGKQFISIDDLKKLKNCNINTLLEYL